MNVSERGAQLIALFSKTIGAEAANDLVKITATRLKLSMAELDSTGAIEILEEISQSDGRVGVTARFAKVRFMLPSMR